MAFIRLTRPRSGGPDVEDVLVNLDQVRYAMRARNGSTLHFAQDHKLQVAESLDEIAESVNVLYAQEDDIEHEGEVDAEEPR